MKRIITLLILVLQTFFSFSQEKPKSVLNETVGYKQILHELSQANMLKPTSDPGFEQRTIKPDGTSGGMNVKGNITFIANNVLSIDNSSYDPEDPYDGGSSNGSVNMQYIDIDNDNSTFSSSSDVLSLPACSRVVYAGLYWAGIYPYENWGDKKNDREREGNPYQMKFKLPGGVYQDIIADANDVTKRELIYDNSVAYICYKDITADIQGLSSVNPDGHNGTYVAANIRAIRGNDPAGLGGSGGWTMVVIYENQTESSKNIAVFDGFANVYEDNNVDISYSGFTTVPVGPDPSNPAPVRAKLLAAALEGDRSINWDSFQINNRDDGTGTYVDQYTPNVNPRSWSSYYGMWRYNFFNGSISRNDQYVTSRIPNSENTLGFDVDLYELNNTNNSIITNNQTSAHVRFTSNQDTYWPFLNALAVEIIEPKLQMVKSVVDGAGNDVQGASVTLGSELWYDISFQNVGTDDARNTIITDRLPKNVDLLETSTGGTVYNGMRFDISLPPGVTIVGYEAPSETNGFRAQVEFSVPDDMVRENGAEHNIRIHVKVVEDCSQLRDVCSNEIRNQAFARYEGIRGGVVVDNEPSYSGFDNCDFGIVGSSNFLVDINDCRFIREEVLCGSSLELTAGEGFDSYSWVDQDGQYLGGTRSIIVYGPGVYTVTKVTNLGCLTKPEIVEVKSFADVENPLAPPFADQFNTACTSSSVELAEVYLCGSTTDSRDITLPFAGSNTTVEWFKLNGDGGCGYNFETDNCAPTSTDCSWTPLGTDLNMSFSETGAYKLQVLYDGTCPKTYYFNVFRDSLSPTIVPTDILCGTNGSIVVNGVPNGYEYSLSGNGTTTSFQTDNTFVITNSGDYTVSIRKVGANGSCTYITDSVNIQSLDIGINVLTDIPLCASSPTELIIQVEDVPGKYSYEVTKGGAYVAGSNGFIDNKDQSYTITTGGLYEVYVQTEAGCEIRQTVGIELTDPTDLLAVTTKNITCENGSSPGIITLMPGGGVSPYEFAVISFNGTPVPDADKVYFTDTTYEVPMGSEGTYIFEVRDNNNCNATAEATVVVEPALQFTATPTHIVCNGDANGTIEVNLEGGNPSNYTIRYSIDNFSTSNDTGVFSGLSGGDYIVNIRATKDGYQCNYQVTATITEPEAISGDVVKERDYNCGAGGKVRFENETGGTGAYEYGVGVVDTTTGDVTNITYYSFDDNGSAEAVFNSLTPGFYRFYIRDANGCVYEIPGDIEIFDSPNAPQLVPNITYNCNGTGNVVLGPPSEIKNNFEYSLDGGDRTNVNNFPNLDPGPHNILVYYKGQDCSTLVEFEIEQGQEFTAIATGTNITCNGGTDGSITITAENFGTSFQYSLDGGTSWNPGQITSSPYTITGLSAGNYSVSVRSNVNSIGDCQVDIPGTIDLTEPTAVTVTAEVTKEITCDPATGATISILTTGGGNGGYTYELLDSSNNAIPFTDVPEGSYNVVATDKDGCTSAPFPITVNPKEDLDFTVTPVQCFDGSNGTLTVNIGTGNGGYSYMIVGETGWQTSNEFTNLLEGTYNVRVRDEKGCELTKPATIRPQLTATFDVTHITSCTPGKVDITASGGDGNYVYQAVVAGGTFSNMSNSSSLSLPLPGDYDVYVRDNGGNPGYCEVKHTVTVTKTEAPIVSSSNVIQPKCNTDTGTINVTVGEGTSPYTVTVTGPGGPYSQGPSTDVNYSFPGLAAGNYSVSINDADGCSSVPVSLEVIVPDALATGGPTTATDLMCSPSGTILGSITFQVPTGGTADYLYFYKLTTNTDYIQAGSTTVTNLDAGEYNTKVVDANGCELPLNNVTIAPLPEVTLTVSPVTYNCDGTGNFTVTTNPAGSYTYTLGAISNTDGVFTNIPEGSHVVSVAIGSNCTEETDPIIVAPNQEFTATITNSSKTCIGSNDGTITIEAYFPAGTPTATFDYSTDGGTTWTNGVANPHTITNLPVGLNTIEVRPNSTSPAACVITLQETLEDPTPMVLTLPITKEVTCNVPTGATITPNVTGGYGGTTYTYELFDSSGVSLGAPTNSEFTNVDPGTYTVTAADVINGCTISNTVTVAPAESVTFDAAALCFDGTNGQIEISNITGNGDYSYSLNGSTNFTPITSDPFTISGLSSESYTVRVKDGKGCFAEETVVINNLLYATATPTNASCTPPTNPTGEISVTATGGDGTHEFAAVISTATPADPANAPAAGDYSGTNPITGLAPATYDVYVRDGSGCSYIIEDVVIAAVTPVDITATPNQPECNGYTGSVDGQIVANTGQAPYTIEITNTGGTFTNTIPNFTGASFSFNNLPVDAYEIKITDALGCEDTFDFTLNNPTPILMNLEPVLPADCNLIDPTNTGFDFNFKTYTLTDYAPYDLEYTIDGTNWFPITDAMHSTSVAPHPTPGDNLYGVRGLTPGQTYYPSIRIVNSDGTTRCREDNGIFIMPYQVSGIVVKVTVTGDCNIGYSVEVEAQDGSGASGFEFGISTEDPINTGTWHPADDPTKPRIKVFDNIIPGLNYQFFVKDIATGCIEMNNKPINYPDSTFDVAITPTAVNQSCNGADNGELSFFIEDTDGVLNTKEVTWELYNGVNDQPLGITGTIADTAGYPYTLNSSGTPVAALQNLSPGLYFIVLDAFDGGVTACQWASGDVEILEGQPITGNLNKLNDITCSVPGKIRVENVLGGFGPYTYTATTSDPLAVATVVGNEISVTAPTTLTTVDVTVEVVDNNSPNACTANLGTVTLNVAQLPTLTVDSTANCDPLKSITVSAIGGSAPYQYSINGGAFTALTSGSHTFTGLAEGDHTVVVRDANGCENTITGGTAVTYPALEFDLTTVQNMYCTPSNAIIGIEITSGANLGSSGDFTYTVTPAGTASPNSGSITGADDSQNITVTAVDTYEVTVTDVTSGCSQTKQIPVAPAVLPDFSYEVENSVCAGDNSGSIRVTSVDNGILPLTYEINNDPSDPSTPVYNATLPAGDSVFTGLAPGTYTVTAESTINGCLTIKTGIVITEYLAINLTDPVVDEFKCNAGTNTVNVATVTVPNGAGDISGGSGNYTSLSFTYTPITGSPETKTGSSFEFTTTNTSGGTVDIIVYDSEGCSATTTANIAAFEPMIGVTANQDNAITCTTLESIIVEANPNVAGIEYRVVGPGYNQAITGTGSPVTFAGLATGDYTVTATHPTTNCVVETFYKVGPEPVYDIVVSDVQNESCKDANDGSVLIDFRPTGDYGDQYDFELFDANTGASIDLSSNPGGLNIPHQGVNAPTPVHNLPAGNYYITITMTASPNCKATTEIFTIYEPTRLGITADVNPVVSCTDGNDATIIAKATGGWGNYIYQLEEEATGNIIGSYDFATNGGNNIFTNLGSLASGQYRVRVRDGNGCTISTTISIANPDPITFSTDKNDNVCDTSVGGSITINATGGTNTYVYSITSASYSATQTINAPSFTFSNLPADTYTVNVVDSKGCTALTAPIDVTINPKVNFSLVETKKIDCTPTPNGIVTVDLTNWTSGVSNYEYEVVDSSGGSLVLSSPVTSNPFTISIPNGNPTPETYTVTVRDMDSQPKPECEVSKEIIINPRIEPVFTAQATVNNICSGSSTGEITVSSTDNGISPLIYRINPQPTGWSFNNNVFSGLPAGTYTITAEGTNDCITSTDVTINENSAIDISNAVTFTQFNCTVGNETNSATIVVDKSAIIGGTGNYVRVEIIDNATGTVLYNGNNFTYTSTDEAGGTYTVNVYDENEGCFATENVTINPFVKITGLTVDPQRKIDCNDGEDIIATHTVVGGSLTNFEYRLYDNAAGPTATPIETRTNTDGDFTQFLAPGTYRIELENLDTNCIETEYYVVGPVPSYDVFLTNIQRACFNGTGSVDFYFSPSTSYTDAFDYEVIPVGGGTAVVSGNVAAGAASPITISGIAPGEYYVQIRMTDSPYCTPRSVDFEIAQPTADLTLAYELTYLKCTPTNSGAVNLAASGGWGAYQYELVNNTSGSTEQSFDNNAIITGLTAGDYTATVRDINGCTTFTNFTLEPGTTITGDFNVTPNLCEGEYTATIEVTNVQGGQEQDPNLTYSYILVYPDGTESASQSSPIFTNLPAGNGYIVKVADGYSCDGPIGPINIVDPTEVVASADIIADITCNDPQAVVEVTGAGGTGPYMYSMDGITFVPANSGSNHTFNVDAGTHQFFVRDSELCISDPTTLTIGAYEALVATLNVDSAFITCNGDSNAVLSANVDGGFANNTYQLLDENNTPLSNWQPSNTFSGLDVGTYKINVRSTNRFGEECFAVTGEHTITEPEVLDARAIPTRVTCFGGSDGTITVNATGGNEDYEFNIVSDPSRPEFPPAKFVKNNVFENLTAGVYWITVKDVVGCYMDPIRVEVEQPEQFTASLIQVNNQVCIEDATPTIELDVQGGTQPYYVSINNNPLGIQYTTNTIVLGAAENIQAGEFYYITVSDEAGCNVVDPIRVTTEEPVDLQLTVDFAYTCEVGNVIKAIVDDKYKGSTSYTLYDGNGNSIETNNEGEFFNLPAGVGYHVVATHTATGCNESSISTPISIENIEALTLEIDDSVKNTLIANADFGLEPYEYSVDGGDFGPDNEFLILQTKDYTITVRDARGCEVTLTVRGEYISIFVPNLFSPDGDGDNDYWYPREVEDYHDIKVFIYDRYARKIINFQGIQQGWDGTYDGKPLPSGDYWYTIYFKELSGQEKKIMGHFTLYR